MFDIVDRLQESAFKVSEQAQRLVRAEIALAQAEVQDKMKRAAPGVGLLVFAGALADKYDPRRLIQIGMGLFMLCSLTWGILFTTGWLEWWHAIVILTVHGIASVFWGTPSQVILHDIVGREFFPVLFVAKPDVQAEFFKDRLERGAVGHDGFVLLADLDRARHDRALERQQRLAAL